MPWNKERPLPGFMPPRFFGELFTVGGKTAPCGKWRAVNRGMQDVKELADRFYLYWPPFKMQFSVFLPPHNKGSDLGRDFASMTAQGLEDAK